MTDTSRSIQVTIDPKGAETGARRVNSALASIAAQTKKMAANDNAASAAANKLGDELRNTGSAARKAAAGLDDASDSASKTSKNVDRATGSFQGLKRVVAALGLAYVAKQFMDLSDASSTIAAKLNIATAEFGNLARAQSDVTAIANRSRSDISAVADLYSVLARNANDLKINQDSVSKATETVGKALKIGGAGAAQASSAILQLSQSLGAGKLAGDEFASLSENAPRLMKILADSMGVPRGALKALASEGKITADVITKALTDPKILAQIEAEFAKIPATFADVRTAAVNLGIGVAGALAKGLNISSSLSGLIAQVQSLGPKLEPVFTKVGEAIRSSLAVIAPVFSAIWSVAGPILSLLVNNLDTLTKVAMAAAGAFIAFKVAAGIQWALSAAAGIGAMATSFIAANGAAAAATVGVTTLRTAALGLVATLGGPLGIALAVATAGVGYFMYKNAEAKAAAENLTASINSQSVEFGTLVQKQRQAAAESGNLDATQKAALTSTANLTGEAHLLANAWARVAAEAKAAALEQAKAAQAQALTNLRMAKTAYDEKKDKAFRKAAVRPFAERGLGANAPALNSKEALSAANRAVQNTKEQRELIQATTNLNAANKQVTDLANSKLATFKPTPAAVAAPSGGGASSKGSGGKSKAETEAERMKKAQEDYWKGLNDNLALSKLSTSESEVQRKQLELQGILKRDLNAMEKVGIQAIVEQTKANKFLVKNEEDHALKMRDLNNEKSALQKKFNGMTDDQFEIYQAGESAVNAAIADNVKLSGDQLDLVRKRAELEASVTQEIRNQNVQKARGRDLIADALKGEVARRNAASDRAAIQASVKTYSSQLGRVITQDDADRAIKVLDQAVIATAMTFRDEMGQRINELGEQIGGKWGGAISKIGNLLSSIARAAQGDYSGMGALGGIASIFSSKQSDGSFNGIFGSKFATSLSGGITEGMKGVQDSLFSLNTATNSGFGSLQTAFGKNGDLVKGLGGAMGSAMAGAQIGGAVAGIGKALGIGMSNTGAQIGGAIGSFIPIPGGAIIGSVIGGLTGNLFKKKKYGTASISQMADGSLDVGSLTGNSGSRKDAANSAGSAVAAGIQEIANALGATISGSPSVSIGTYKDKWRVSSTGRTGKLKGKYSDVTDFGKDGADAAIAYAIQESLKDGILTGISQFSQRVLKSLDVEKALPIAQSYEAILKDLAAFKNPIKATVEETVKSIDTLAKQMRAAGATSAELANVEEWRALKLKSVLEEQVGGFQDLLKQLNGPDAGVSALSLLTKDMKELDTFRAKIASGATVDQDAFTQLGQDILSNASAIYGTNSVQFQNIIKDLKALTQSALDTATSEFDKYSGKDSTVTAINDQTNQIVSSLDNLPDRLVEALNAIGWNQAAANYKAVNGKMLNFW